MPPSVCPRCKTPYALPAPAACSMCGEPLRDKRAGASSVGAIPTASPAAVKRGARLIGRLADGTNQEFAIDGVKLTLGRHPANTLRLVDREVSKEHAAIERIGATFVLKDLGSSNGTFVNGRRIRELRLKDGDEIALGGSKLVFHSGEPATLPGGGSAPQGGVTIVGSAHSMPAFIAQLDQREEGEFRPAEELHDFASLRQDYEKLRIAHEFHRQVGLERDQKSLLDKILKVSFQLLAADNGVIFLADAKGALSPAAVSKRKPSDDEVVVSDTLLKRVLDTRQAVLSADAILDARFSSSESIVAQGIRSAMAVPLLAKGTIKGVLVLDTRERTNAFSEKDLKILSGVASQAAVALENAEFARKLEAEAITRAELSRFLSPAIAELVVKGDVELLRQGQLQEVSVLFADIRGFTSMSENEAPQDVVNMLNEFFTACANVVFRHEGNLDKFIGDCVMAVWGPPSAHADDALRAVKAALEMQTAVEELNARRKSNGRRPIEVGIGVNTGQAVVGYMGSQERHEFTAIGDSVNTAARLCSLAKGGEVLVSAFSVDKSGGKGFNAEALPTSFVKGKEKGVATYRVTSLSEA